MEPLRLLTRISILLLGAPFGIIWAQEAATTPVSAAPGLPLPARSATPIDFFRHLLAANPTVRAKLLAGKNPEHRRILENSLRSYDSLQPQERESRLHTMELRYRLTTLLRVAPSNRVDYLKAMPDSDRPLLEERLRIWDQLSPEEQELLLVQEKTGPVLTGVNRASFNRNLPINVQTSNQLRLIELQLVRWQSVPPQRRGKIQKLSEEIFNWNPTNLNRQTPLTTNELDLIQKSLDQFRRLAPAQREQCLRNFERFAGLSPSERREFLISAQNWQQMKPEDRKAWRNLVSRMPPLPPRVNYLPIPKATPRLFTTTN